MPDRITVLNDAERAALIATLVRIQARLDEAGEMLAAARIATVLDCLNPQNPANGEPAQKLH